MKDNFYLGMIASILYMALIQDYIGKEEMINILQTGWTNIAWQMWLVPILILHMFVRANQRYNESILKAFLFGSSNKDPGFPADPEDGQTFTKPMPTKFCFDEKVGAWLICGQEVNSGNNTDSL